MTEFGSFVLVSQVVREDVVKLLLAQQLVVRGKPIPVLRRKLNEIDARFQPIEAASLRRELSSGLGQIMTEHLMKVLDSLEKDPSDVVTYTAWKYRNLISWGEASAARELALDMKLPVHTVHNRLRIARDRGILPSPGPGSRLG